MIRLTSPARLHFGLFDLGTATPRIYGGVGVAVVGPETRVTVHPAAVDSIQVGPHLDAAAQMDLSAAIARLRGEVPGPPALLSIDALPPQHVGLGTKTSLILASLTALARHSDAPLAEADLQRLSRRGGTSGIGVHTFFEGGFVIDGGHAADEVRNYFPSSSSWQPGVVPPLLARLAMPSEWCATLVLQDGSRRSAMSEREFFGRSTPVPNAEVEATVAAAVNGLAAGAATADLDAFTTGLDKIQRIGFKAREIEAQPPAIRDLLDRLAALPNCAGGMSSMGPIVAAITRRDDEVAIAGVHAAALSLAGSVLGTYEFSNQGFAVDER